MAKFYTKSGWLTPYALACGYIQQLQDRDLTLSHINSNIYQITVRCNSDFAKGFNWSDWDRNSVIYIKCFEGINEARRIYRRIGGAHQTRRLPKRYERGANQMVYT